MKKQRIIVLSSESNEYLITNLANRLVGYLIQNDKTKQQEHEEENEYIRRK